MEVKQNKVTKEELAKVCEKEKKKHSSSILQFSFWREITTCKWYLQIQFMNFDDKLV